MSNPLDALGVALSADELIALRPLALASRHERALAALPGGFATKRKGRGLEVADTREYAPGDDMRHLDRGTTARTGRLHVRQFQEERDQVTLLVADFRPSMFWGLRRALRSVAAAEALALMGWGCVESGGRVGLLTLSSGAPVTVPARGRVRGMLDVIGGMVRAHRKALQSVAEGTVTDQPLARGLQPIARLVPPGADVVIASGFDTQGQDLADTLSVISQRRQTGLIHVTDANPSDLPPGRYPVRLRDGRLVDLRLDAANKTSALDEDQVAGHPALVVNAGDTVQQMARILMSGFAVHVARAPRTGQAA